MRIGNFIYDFRRIISPYNHIPVEMKSSRREVEDSIGEVGTEMGSSMSDQRQNGQQDAYSGSGRPYDHKKNKNVGQKLDVRV